MKKTSRIISIINFKGGTGKTTTVINLAAGLARQGKKVLVVDTDPQGSVAFHLGIKAPYTLYDLLFDRETLNKIIVPARTNLDIIAANETLFAAELTMSKVENRELVLKSKLAPIEHIYDFILIDCGPSLNLFNQNALLFSKEVLIPISLEYLSMLGLKQLIKNMRLLTQRFKHQLKINHIVPTMFDKRKKKATGLLNQLKGLFPDTQFSPIRVCNSVADASGFQKTIFEYKLNSNGAKDYQELTLEVIRNE